MPLTEINNGELADADILMNNFRYLSSETQKAKTDCLDELANATETINSQIESVVSDIEDVNSDIEDINRDIEENILKVVTETGHCPIDDAGNFTVAGIQQVMYKEDDILWAQVGNTQGNGNWLVYNAGNYYKKNTYNNGSIIEIEYGGEIYLNVTQATSVQLINFVAPSDIEDLNFIGNVGLSVWKSNSEYEKGAELRYVGQNNFVGTTNKVMQILIPSRSSSRAYTCVLHWNLKKSKIAESNQGGE